MAFRPQREPGHALPKPLVYPAQRSPGNARPPDEYLLGRWCPGAGWHFSIKPTHYTWVGDLYFRFAALVFSNQAPTEWVSSGEYFTPLAGGSPAAAAGRARHRHPVLFRSCTVEIHVDRWRRCDLRRYSANLRA